MPKLKGVRGGGGDGVQKIGPEGDPETKTPEKTPPPERPLESNAAFVLARLAREGASSHHPKTKKIGGTKYVVHNAEAANLLRAHWSAAALEKTIRTLENAGTFTVTTDPRTGLIRTADAPETWEMNDRQWTTDSVMCGLLQKRRDPENYKKAMSVNAAFVLSPKFIEHVEKTIADPAYFREGGKMNGAPHIFLPASVHWNEKTQTFDAAAIELDQSWFNHKRLESQALLLGALADLVREDAYAAVPAQNTQVREAIDRLARYLIAVNTDPKTGKPDFAAPSASSWEETPLPGGMTWDTAATVLAMEKLRGLGFVSEDRLEEFIEQGRKNVAKRLEHMAQHPLRPADTSLVLLAASDYVFDRDDPAKDAGMRAAIVEAMKKELLRENGMLRYSTFTLPEGSLHDSYLNRDFWMPTPLRAELASDGGDGDKAGQAGQAGKVPLKEYGATDVSEVSSMLDRQTLSKPEYSAQWCLGLSASLQALARAKITLLEHGREVPEALQKSLDDMINRNLAVLSPAGATKSTGHPAPAWKVMEAYEAVTDLDGRVRFVPGAHPLSWGTAQLFDGLLNARLAAELAGRAK